MQRVPTNISTFFIAGINYKKMDAISRGQFAIGKDQYTSLLSLAPKFGIKEFFVLSTCNRTEIYGFAEDALSLCELLCSQTTGSLDTFLGISYIKNGKEAIKHLFDVAAGLESQILGDYEIVGQIKQAVKFAKQHQFIGTYLERLVNSVLQSSKMIKSTTSLSGGTVSVAFAAVQYLRESVINIKDKRILLIGTGKMGRNTCKNLVDYTGAKEIILVNRTEEKASRLANDLGLQYGQMNNLAQYIHSADIIVVATNATNPLILASHVENSGPKLIIDLSIPYNVEKAAQHLPNITMVNVDELSRIKDETLSKRKAEIPHAKLIIETHINEFLLWHDMRKNVSVLKEVKNKLRAMNSCQLYRSTISHTGVTKNNPEVNIQKVINGMAVKMRNQYQSGCYYIEAINEYMATGSN